VQDVLINATTARKVEPMCAEKIACYSAVDRRNWHGHPDVDECYRCLKYLLFLNGRATQLRSALLRHNSRADRMLALVHPAFRKLARGSFIGRALS
jgi:hypothetical protein